MEARRHNYTFVRDERQLERFVQAGYLVQVRGNRDYTLKDVSFPYARPEVRTFVERLGRQYRSACGERLVVTSLVRPREYQPGNASWRSVHPTGMAIDLRKSRSRRCRSWLERVLLSLEGRRVLEASRERRPPHYHVALFPNRYAAYLARRGIPQGGSHRVARGESLWQIARRYGTTVHKIRSLNDLPSDIIRPGQMLRLP